MKIIISPSKTQKESINTNNCFLNITKPYFEEIALKINSIISKELNSNPKIWKELEIKSNPKLELSTKINVNEFPSNKNMAILKYDGLQFKNIEFEKLNENQQNNLNNNLIILSAYYGCLKPSDEIGNYRLMMNSKINIENDLDVKTFWKTKIIDYLKNLDKTILNLASDEYSSYLDRKELNIIDVFFYINKNNKLTNLATNAKMCRGVLVNLLSNYDEINLDILKNLEINGHKFNKELSNKNKLVYVKN